MNLIPLPYRLLAIVLLAIACLGAGFVFGCHITSTADELKASNLEDAREQALIASHVHAQQQEQAWATTASLIEDTGYQSLQEKTRENDHLRDAVESQRVQLRLAAHCPADLPAPASGGGVDHGAGPVLDAGARPHYFALRRGIVTVEQQLSACQAELVNDRKLIP